MKIAVTYENGEIFQHFGRTETFKLYTVEYGKLLDSEVVPTCGSGHGALADFLSGRDVTLVICGGVGGGMKAALEGAGIRVISGIEGSADEAVEAFLRGELTTAGITCSCHGEDHDCHSHAEGACSCGCGSAPGGKNTGKTCRVHYCGTLNDGTKFDSSYDRGEPIEFVCGAGMMIRGFDEAVADMEVGEIRDIHLTPAEAYGEADPAMIFVVEQSRLPGCETLSVGQKVYLRNPMGQPFTAKVIAKDDTTITFDANHEMAGRELNFRVELVEVR